MDTQHILKRFVFLLLLLLLLLFCFSQHHHHYSVREYLQAHAGFDLEIIGHSMVSQSLT